jgi:hypothetical protein
VSSKEGMFLPKMSKNLKISFAAMTHLAEGLFLNALLTLKVIMIIIIIIIAVVVAAAVVDLDFSTPVVVSVSAEIYTGLINTLVTQTKCLTLSIM